MKLNFYFLITFICLLNLTCFSQGREFNFINYTQENGLPSNESYFIYRDSKNFLWIATDKGVVRYDGNKMENFDLPDNVIFKIREDSKGRIWFFHIPVSWPIFIMELFIHINTMKTLRSILNPFLF